MSARTKPGSGSARRARQGKHRPVHLLGFGEGHTHGFLTSLARPGRTGAARSGPMAFERSGRALADIDIALLYDAFASNPAMILEEAGFVKPGGAGDFYRDGRADPGGDRSSNWLPSPKDENFVLALRAYIPRADMLNGKYQVPQVEEV